MHWRSWGHVGTSSVWTRNLQVVLKHLSNDSSNNAAACECWNRTHHAFLPGCLPPPVKRTASSLTAPHRRFLHPSEQPPGADAVNVLAEPLPGASTAAGCFPLPRLASPLTAADSRARRRAAHRLRARRTRAARVHLRRRCRAGLRVTGRLRFELYEHLCVLLSAEPSVCAAVLRYPPGCGQMTPRHLSWTLSRFGGSTTVRSVASGRNSSCRSVRELSRTRARPRPPSPSMSVVSSNCVTNAEAFRSLKPSSHLLPPGAACDQSTDKNLPDTCHTIGSTREWACRCHGAGK